MTCHADLAPAFLEPYVEALVAAFGVDRCIWGSDWPFTRIERRVDYGLLLGLVNRWFGDGDRCKVLWSNPVSLFGFNE